MKKEEFKKKTKRIMLRSPNTKKITTMILTIIIILLITIYVKKNYEDFKVLSNLSAFELIILLISNLILSYINAAILVVQLKVFGIQFKRFESLPLIIITTFSNTLLPFRAGIGVQAIYLKKIHQFRYSNYLSALAGVYIISFFSFSLIGIITSCLIYFTTNEVNLFILLIFITLLFATIASVIFPKMIIHLIPFNSLKKKVKNVVIGWETLVKSRNTILKLTILMLINILMVGIIFLLQLRFLEIKNINNNYLNLWESLYIASFSVISLILNITPSSLGIKEVLIAYSSNSVSLSSDSAVVVSLLDRAIGLVYLLIATPLAYLLLKRKNH